MKAMIYTRYGPPEVLQLKDVPKPVPKDHEVLINIRATAANSGDLRLRKADPFAVRLFFGLTKPNKPILGSAFSGVVEAVGIAVKNFKAGDAVFGATGMGFGAYAAYKCLAENATIALKPGNLTHEEAAVLPFGGNTALHFLRKAAIKKGQKVLIYGASGAVGTAAIQLAKHLGAHVTGVCSTANMALIKSLGADTVIDYTREDFTERNETYDVIYDTVGKVSFSRCRKTLNKKGVLILGASGMSGMIQGLWASITGKRKVVTGITSENAAGLLFLKELAEANKLQPVIDRTYPLEQMVAAHTYIAGGHKKGNVAITVAGG